MNYYPSIESIPKFPNSNKIPPRCTECGGTGKIQVTGTKYCDRCAGTGRNMKSNCYSAPCIAGCDRGKVVYISREYHSRCNGTGYLPY